MSPRVSSAKLSKKESYARYKKRAAEHFRQKVAAGQDISPLPGVVNPYRRVACEKSFKLFCETYFPLLFYLDWSDDHLRVITKTERVVLYNETFAVAMPRGSGKTTLSICGVLWAILTGKHPFIYLISSADDNAKKLLVNLKNHLAGNPLLLEDFPEVCYPIRALENEARRCKGQRYYGVQTDMEFTSGEIVMPTIPGSPASGTVVRVVGLTGNFRGAVYVKRNGESIRPSLVICDDPQTDSSAKSIVQTEERMRILKGAVAGLAGPGKRTGVIVPCTVIQPDDLSDQLLDRKRNPTWRGERTKLIYKFPENKKLWDEYRAIRQRDIENDGGGEAATSFYERNRKEMDEGAEPAWEDRYLSELGEISAVQHAMNLKFDLKDEVFASEYQNEPMLPADQMDAVTPEQVCFKANGRERNTVPPQVTKLVAHIDVHDKLLFYTVMGFTDDFTGYVIDKNTYPDQKVPYFTMQNAKFTLSGTYKGMSVDGAIQSGLEHLVKKLLNTTYKRGQTLIQIDKLLVDIGYKPEIVNAVKIKCGGSTLQMARGVGITASKRAISEYKRKPGEVYGHHWYVPVVTGTQEFPHVNIDVNYWKTFVHTGFRTTAGDPESITIYGKPEEHELYADHIAGSEYSVLTHGRGRDVREWKLKPSKPDNHWFDNIVACCAAASILGARAVGHSDSIGMRSGPKVRLSELQRQKQAARWR